MVRLTMKVHTTNYCNTLIEIAEDCPIHSSEIPPLKGNNKSVANLQYEMLRDAPYKFTSDDILFAVYARRKEYSEKEWDKQRAIYFSKGQPCFRASPLTKRYGFGIHSNEEGKIAMFGTETEEYTTLLRDNTVKKVKAMRSKRLG